MADFPRAHSERALTTRQPRALRADADIRKEAAGHTKTALGAVDAMSKSLVKWEAAVEKVQRDTFLYNYKTGSAAIASDAVIEQDITSEAKFQKRQQDLRKTLTDAMGNPRLAKKMDAELNYMETMAGIGIQTEFRKKTVIQGQTTAEANLDLVVQNPTPRSEYDIEAFVDDAINSGYWDVAQGAKEEKKYKKQLKMNRFIQNLNDDPAKAQKNLSTNKYGFDIQELDNAHNIFQRELKVIQDQTSDNFEERFLDPDLPDPTKDEVLEKVAKKKLDPRVGKAMIKNIETIAIPKVEKNESIAQANILTAHWKELKDKERWFGPDASFEDRTQFRAAVFTAHDNGWITTATMDDYLGMSQNKFFKTAEFTNALQSVFDMSEDYVSTREKETAKQLMSKALIDKVQAGMNPRDALSEAIEERIGSDFPGVDPIKLVYTAKKRNLKVWQVYKLMKPQGEESAD